MVIKELEDKASRGSVDAQFQLANCYYHGDKVKKDVDEAIYWYMMASENGHIKSSEILGDIYLKGINGEVDKGLAREFFEKSNLDGAEIDFKEDDLFLKIEQKKQVSFAPPGEHYFGEFPKYKLLTREEEVDLFEKYRTGSKEAEEKLLICNLKLVFREICKYLSMEDPMFWDMFQEGVRGLLRSLKDYDQKKGHKFSTYSFYWIKQHITRGIQNDSKLVKIPSYVWGINSKISSLNRNLKLTSNDDLIHEICKELNITREKYFEVTEVFERRYIQDTWTGDDGSDFDFLESNSNPEEAVLQKVRKEGVARVLSKLEDREEEVIRLRYGFDGENVHTLQEIGDKLGVTRERIRQIEKKTLGKIKVILKKEHLYSLPLEKKEVKIHVNRQKVSVNQEKTLGLKETLPERLEVELQEQLLWGEKLIEVKRYDEAKDALECLEKSIELLDINSKYRKKTVEKLLNIGMKEMELGYAGRYYEKCINLAPEETEKINSQMSNFISEYIKGIVGMKLFKEEGKEVQLKMSVVKKKTTKDIYLEISEIENGEEKRKRILEFFSEYSTDATTEEYRYELYQDLILSYLDISDTSNVRKYSKEAVKKFSDRDISIFEEAYRDTLDEDYFRILCQQGEDYQDEEKYEEALKIYEKIEEDMEYFEYSKKAEVYRDMGDIYAEKDPEIAISYYKKAMEGDKSKTIILSMAINNIVEVIIGEVYNQATMNMIKKEYLLAKPYLEKILKKLNDLGNYKREFFEENKLIYTDALLDLKDVSINIKDYDLYTAYYEKTKEIFGLVEEIEEINQEFNDETKVKIEKNKIKSDSLENNESKISVKEEKLEKNKGIASEIKEEVQLKKEDIEEEEVKELVLEVLENIRKEDIDIFKSMKENQGDEREIKGLISGIEGMLEIKFGQVSLDLIPHIEKIDDLGKVNQVKERIMVTRSLQDIEELVQSFK